MLKQAIYIIVVILIQAMVGCKENSTSPTPALEGPAVPELTIPQKNMLFKSDVNTIELVWTDIEDASSYKLQVSDNKYFSSNFIEEEGYSTSQYIMNNNYGNGVYFWRVRSIDFSKNMSDWSEAKTFIIGGKKDIDYMEDIDGNIYRIVKIGNQWWMAENLAVTHYRNGDAIPNVIKSGEWVNQSIGAYCAYDNDKKYANTYGYLYNWYTVDDGRNIAPVGWHVPTNSEWTELGMYLGMSETEANKTLFIGTNEGGKLKEASTTNWNRPNTGATDEYGFTALAGGRRRFGEFTSSLGEYAIFWTSTNMNNEAWIRGLPHDQATTYRDSRDKQYGASLRCVRD